MKKKRKLLIFTVILAIYVLVIGSYIVYDKLETKKLENENNKNGIKDVIESVSETIVEPIQEVLQTNTVDENLENVIKTTLTTDIAKDLSLTMSSNAFYAEGHKILKTENSNNQIIVYLTGKISAYVLKNGSYVNTSSIANPFKITFTDNYEFVSYEMPNDDNWEASLKEIFPSDLAESASSVDYRVDFYQNQINAYFED